MVANKAEGGARGVASGLHHRKHWFPARTSAYIDVAALERVTLAECRKEARRRTHAKLDGRSRVQQVDNLRIRANVRTRSGVVNVLHPGSGVRIKERRFWICAAPQRRRHDAAEEFRTAAAGGSTRSVGTEEERRVRRDVALIVRTRGRNSGEALAVQELAQRQRDVEPRRGFRPWVALSKIQRECPRAPGSRGR